MRSVTRKEWRSNACESLSAAPHSGLSQTKKFIARWHGKERQLYCVALSSKPISSLEHIQMTGVVWYEHPETYLQGHVSEKR
jgi:guanine deaminase